MYFHNLMEKDAPHEHPCSALGLPIILKADRISSTWKSTVEPARFVRAIR